MKLTKILLAILLVGLFVVTLMSCSGDYGSNPSTDTNENINNNTDYQRE